MYKTSCLKGTGNSQLRSFPVLSLSALPLALVIFLSGAQPALAEAIRSFDSSIMLAKDGHLAVEEKITYDFEGESRHGIERFIPVQAKLLGLKERLRIDVKSASDNVCQKYSVFEKNGYKVIKIGSPDTKVTGVQTYQINYEVDGAFAQAAKSGSPASLSWPVTGDKWKVPINHASVMVYAREKTILPQAKMSAEYGLKTGLHKAKSDITSNSAIFEASNLKPGEGLNLSVVLPAATIAPTNELKRVSWQAGSFLNPANLLAGIPPVVLNIIVIGLALVVVSVITRALRGNSRSSNCYHDPYYYDNYNSGSSSGGGSDFGGGSSSGSGDGGGGSW